MTGDPHFRKCRSSGGVPNHAEDGTWYGLGLAIELEIPGMLSLYNGVDVGTSFMINDVLSTQSAQNFIGRLESSIAARDRPEIVLIPRSLTPSCQGESGLEGSSLMPSSRQ